MNTAGSVLLADDEELFRFSTAALLRHDGFACDCAESGPQTIEMLRKDRYDVLIADICMEGNSDLSLVRDARQMVPGLPVILVTGHPSLETAVPSIQLSVMAYLKKPVDYSQLLEQVCQATQHSTIQRSMTEIHKRLSAVAEEFVSIQNESSPHSEHADLIPLSVVRDLSAVLSQILRLRATLGCQDGDQSICGQCQIHPNYEDAIAETIEILKQTKNSFKSKELGGLRLRLESILQKPHYLPHPHLLRATISQRQP
jgi:FixJ family two-component response regulator